MAGGHTRSCRSPPHVRSNRSASSPRTWVSLGDLSAFCSKPLTANKIDLCENDGDDADSRKRQVTHEEAELWAKEEGLLFLEASAKTGDNVDEVTGHFGLYGTYQNLLNSVYRHLTRPHETS